MAFLDQIRRLQACLTVWAGMFAMIALMLADHASARQNEVTVNTRPDDRVVWEDQRLWINLSPKDFARFDRLRKLQGLEDSVMVSLQSNTTISILGKYRVHGEANRISFQPRFALQPGTKLNIQMGSQEDLILKLLYTIPGAKPSASPRITNIFPTADRLPANVLKFYLHFSTPMQKGNIYRHFSIFDLKTKKEVELPFLELEQELWSRDGLRLTLFFDPGRIKRGLKPREEMGAIFEPGGTYEFRVSGKWENELGIALGKDVVRQIKIDEEDNQTPVLKEWLISEPKAGTQQPLTVRFDEPLDAALIARVLSVRGTNGPIKLESISLGKWEQQVELVPAGTWPPGEYALEIGAELEDLCGNRIGKAFDVDLSQPNKNDTRKSFQLKFRLKE